MDLLSQYKQQNPEAFREQKSAPMTDAYGREYSGMIAFVIRLSGGRIRDARGASYTLIIVAAVIVVAAIYLFIYSTGGGVGTPLPYEQTYKPFQ